MESTPQILQLLKRRTSTLNTIVLIATPIAFVIGGVFWYLNNEWKPKVSIVSIDYANGKADLMINGKPKKLYVDSTLNAGFGWGVCFAGTNNDRIELVKNDLTFQTLDIKT